jgi:hypothetical protein
MKEKCKLTDAQKEYVVERLAGFGSPTAIAASLRDEFGISITRQAVVKYDPTRWPKCPERWKQPFFATRQAIIQNKAARGAANTNMLARSHARVTLRAVEALAARMLKAAAREADTGRPEPPRKLTDQERSRGVGALINKVRAAREAGTVPLDAPHPELSANIPRDCGGTHPKRASEMSDLERLRAIAAVFKSDKAARVAAGGPPAKEVPPDSWLNW